MIGKWRAPLLSLALLVPPSCQAQAAPTSHPDVVAALTSHQFQRALDLLSPQLRQNSRDPTLWTLRGFALDGLHRTADSLDSFDHALAMDQEFVPALQGAAQVSYQHGDSHALAYLQKLLALNPGSNVANAMAGALAWQRHDCPGSIHYFSESKDEVYRDPRALDEFADCLLQQQQMEVALRVLTRGAALFPERPDLRYNLAVAQLRSHLPAEAIQTLAPIANRRDAEMLNILAGAYMQTNQPDDAFRALERAIEINPADQANYLDLSILCLEHNQEERSIKAATAGIGHATRTAPLYLIRGVAYAQLAQYDSAEADFVKASEIEPNQPHSTIAMSMLYSDRNQLDKEKSLLTNQLKSTPQDPVANYLFADLLIRSGTHAGQPEFSEAKDHLATSLAVKPDSAEAQILMGHLLEEEQDIPGALTHYTLALRAEPDNRGALDRQFLLLRKLHRNDEATEVLKHLKTVLNKELETESATGAARVVAPHQPAEP